MHKTHKISAAVLAMFLLFASGCSYIPSIKLTVATDSFSDHLSESVDPQKLSFCKRTENAYDIVDYSFMIETDQAEGIADEARKLYKAANEMMAKSEYKGQKIQVLIAMTSSVANVTNYVASFRNFTDNSQKTADDRIVRISVNGVDDMCEGYDKYHYYELNDLNYWNTYSDVEITYMEFVEYQTLRMETESNFEAVKTYLSDFSVYINDAGVFVNESGTHICNFQWDIDIFEDKVIAGNEYASASELIDAMRMKLNEYIAENPDDVLMNNRLEITFRSNSSGSSESYGYIRNFSFKTGEKAPLLEGFGSILMSKATTEELCSLKDVIEINLYKRSAEDIRLILDSVPEIRYVTTHNNKTNDAISADYPQVVFD